MAKTAREVFAGGVVSKEMLDVFLDPDAPNWATFDSELGYRLRDSAVRDGVDNSYTISTYPDTAARAMVNYADQPCRINTYGNSFTQCHQVSDGETWQEYLAAHFGEPVRNFGVGGYGVYQAYRRMLREEETEAAAPYTILNVWSDDHLRSIYAWRWMHTTFFRPHVPNQKIANRPTCLFHGNPWAHLRLNPDSGQFEEHESLCPTPDSLYDLCDVDYIHDVFRGLFDVEAFLALHGVEDVKTDVLKRVADVFDEPTDFSSTESIRETAKSLMTRCSLESSRYVLDQTSKAVEASGKKLLVLLSYPSRDIETVADGKPRFDQPFVDYVQQNNYCYVDTLMSHLNDFEAFNIPIREYTARFYNGHYSPKGNHFFAYAIKDALLEWLNPKPRTYQDDGPSVGSLAAKLA